MSFFLPQASTLLSEVGLFVSSARVQGAPVLPADFRFVPARGCGADTAIGTGIAWALAAKPTRARLSARRGARSSMLAASGRFDAHLTDSDSIFGVCATVFLGKVIAEVGLPPALPEAFPFGTIPAPVVAVVPPELGAGELPGLHDAVDVDAPAPVPADAFRPEILALVRYLRAADLPAMQALPPEGLPPAVVTVSVLASATRHAAGHRIRLSRLSRADAFILGLDTAAFVHAETRESETDPSVLLREAQERLDAVVVTEQDISAHVEATASGAMPSLALSVHFASDPAPLQVSGAARAVALIKSRLPHLIL
jgi:hypothetical protein